MARQSKQEQEAQIDMMIFYVLARMFPKMSETEILDYVPEIKGVIEEFVNGS
jgi:hypothetical protein